MITIYEDRNPKDGVPTNLEKMFKHILNCIYQPLLYHPSWTTSVFNHFKEIQKDIERTSYKKIYKICEDTLDVSYKNGYDLFFKELKNSHTYKNNPYSEDVMRTIIPKKAEDIGKNTKYAKYVWSIDNILNENIVRSFIVDVINNSESAFDNYK